MSIRPVHLIVGTVITLVSVACTGSTPTQDTTPTRDTAPRQAAPAVPSGLSLVEGLARLEVLGPPESGAGEVPLFSWEPAEGAATYDLVVLGPDGPLWAWRGEDTEVSLGALPFERPRGMGGPVIVAGSCWSLIALDNEGHVVAASDFVPISPAESDQHICVPGSGAAPAP